LNQVVPIGERHLRELVREYLIQYYQQRNHQGLDNQMIKPSAEVISINRPVKQQKRLGGILHYYYRDPA
jgi:hypothetical protein